MSFAYLLCLVGSFAGVCAIDRRWRIALWADTRSTFAAAGAAFLVLLVWDFAGIVLGVFRLGDSAAMTGIELLPHLPVEEPVFLAFLSYLSVVAWRLALRLRPRACRASAREQS